MLEELYGWIQNIAVYLIVTSAIMHAIPGKEYEKYVRFFSGLVLILLLFTPLLKLTGKEGVFQIFTGVMNMNWTGKQLKKQSSGLRMSRFWNFSPGGIYRRTARI